MKNKILKGIVLAMIVSSMIACNQKKEETAVVATVDKEQIKSELQAIEDAFAASYNAGKSEEIVYYAGDDRK